MIIRKKINQRSMIASSDAQSAIRWQKQK